MPKKTLLHSLRYPLLGHRMILVAALFMTLLPGAKPATACKFHTYFEQSVFDYFINAKDAVLVRPAPENEDFSFIVERLFGENTLPEKRIMIKRNYLGGLAANLGDAVLFVSDERKKWTQAGYVVADLRPIFKSILKRSKDWKSGYTMERLRFFESLQGHRNPTVRSLALHDIDQAPYPILRQINLQTPVEELREKIWQMEEFKYAPIRIQLLGFAKSDPARQEFYEFMDRVVDRDIAIHLNAFATALIEADGGDGVSRLERQFLSDPGQSMVKLEQVVAALAVHSASGAHAMQTIIAATLERFLEARPEGAPLVARQFYMQQDWSQAGLLKKLMMRRKLRNPGDIMTVAVYINKAKTVAAAQGDRVK